MCIRDRCYSKRTGDDLVIVLLTLDSAMPRAGGVHFTMPALGFDWHESFSVIDELSGKPFVLQEHNQVSLDPHTTCGYIFTLAQGNK